jgi:hypothetical protein
MPRRYAEPSNRLFAKAMPDSVGIETSRTKLARWLSSPWPYRAREQ